MSRQRDPRLVDAVRAAEPRHPLLRRRSDGCGLAPRSSARAPISRRSRRSARRIIPTPTRAGASPSVRCTNRRSGTAAGAADPARRRRRRAADHLHQRRERPARARRRPRARSGDPLGPRRLAHTPGPADAHRERPAVARSAGSSALASWSLATRAILAVAPSNLPRIGEVLPGMAGASCSRSALSIVTGLLVGIFPALTASTSHGAGLAARRHPDDRVAQPAPDARRADRRRSRAGDDADRRRRAAAAKFCLGAQRRSRLQCRTAADHADRVPARFRRCAARCSPFYDELEARLKALPGVTAVGGTTRLPLGSTQRDHLLEVEGRPMPRAELPEVEMRRAVFDYFETMQIPVLPRTHLHARRSPAGAARRRSSTPCSPAGCFPARTAVGRRVRFAAITRTGSRSSAWSATSGTAASRRRRSPRSTSPIGRALRSARSSCSGHAG